MIKKISKNQEFNHFSSIADEWWLPNGKFRILHKIMPLRMSYILEKIEKKKIKGLNVLDIGCGGGLTCEPLARLNANVTGIDFVKKNIEIAIDHSNKSNLRINYTHGDFSSMNLSKKYDLILALEVLEHIDNWKEIILKIKKNLKPRGKVIFSTINRTKISQIFAINIAENYLKWVPKKTHNYNKLIKPKELTDTLIKNNFIIKNITGMNFNPLTREWQLNQKFYPINYFCTAQLN